MQHSVCVCVCACACVCCLRITTNLSLYQYTQTQPMPLPVTLPPPKTSHHPLHRIPPLASPLPAQNCLAPPNKQPIQGQMAFTSLNDPHVLGDDTIYVIIQASSQQMGAMRCAVVFVLPHLTILPLLTIEPNSTIEHIILPSFPSMCFSQLKLSTTVLLSALHLVTYCP